MCGIIGITKTTDEGKIGQQIYEALTRLEYRGYDSVGMAVVSQDGIELAKDKGAIKEVGEKLEFNSYSGTTAIGHSRWATHGPPVQRNAHPHKSMHGRVVVIHNGIIENFMSIKKELIEKGVEFQSDTDTETIPNLIEQELLAGKTMEEAIDIMVSRIEGTFALVISSVDEPNRIYTLRRDNPLVIGITEDAMYCASDIPAFLPWTREVIILRDDELAILEPGRLEIKNTKTGKKVERRPHEVTWDAEAAQKGGFPHFMLKEIHEQAKVLETQLKTQVEIFDEAADIISKAEKVVMVAAGTAYYASLTALHTFPQLAKKVVIPAISAEWNSVSPIVDERTVIIAVSQSGETLDTIKAVKDGKANGATLIAVVNVTGSTLTQIADLTLYIHAGPEIGVAATKTFVAQSYAIWRIAYALAKRNASLSDDELTEFEAAINNLPKTVGEIVRHTEAQARDLAKWFTTKTSAFYLGRGISQIVAFEGALKMKEISYIHAEGYPAGESKHGPIALVEDDYPVVFTIPNDITRDKMMGAVQEMAARGATTVGVIEKDDEEMKETLSHYFEIPKGYSKYCSTIAYIIPQQLMAYYTSVLRGENPDRPRNLAKSVTVE
ncbi:MAG: glutamine--fructose-6-phosphate transaminase (isomerizing) [Candidatus Kariarchaeaceae archaeon]|jgi:glucosamine--fructose-6-phosphate aminotransferase (isomerizing)